MTSRVVGWLGTSTSQLTRWFGKPTPDDVRRVDRHAVASDSSGAAVSLGGDWDVLDDGFGNTWARCGRAACELEIVRPGKVQCSYCEERGL